MKPSDAPGKNPPPVLAVFLLGTGLLSLAASAWLGTVDLPRFVEQQISRAHGTISTETSTWLHESHFQIWLLAGGLGLLALGAIVFLRRQALARFGENIAADPESSRRTFLQSWGVSLVSCLTVFIYFFSTLRSGYFRYDDFDMLATAQSGGWWDTLWLPNGDHFLPLTRLLAWLGLKLFGVTAWPYNLWVLSCLCGVLVIGIQLLAELAVSRPAQLLFAALVIFWSPWAEIMTGYYILSIFLLMTVLGLAAIWFYLRWQAQGRSFQAWGMAACGLLASLVDISGCLVICICGVFLGANLAGGWRTTGWRAWLTQHQIPLGGLAVATALSVGCIAYGYGVLHRGIFLGMAGGGERSLLQLAGDLGYVFSAGLLGAMATPFVYARLPLVLLGGLITAVSTLWLIFSITALRSAGKPRRWHLTAILLVLLGAGLMVCLGRHNPETMIVRWAAKHVCPAYIWLCIFIAVGWDVLWRKLAVQRRALFAELTLIVLGLFIMAQNGFGLLGMAVAFPPFGYPAEIRDAGRRRAAIEALQNQLIGRVAAEAKAAITIPTLDGNYLNAIYPSLFTYNLSRYRPFFDGASDRVRLVRNSAMQPWPGDGVQKVPVLRDAVSPEFLELLAKDSALRSFYSAEIPLAVRTRREPPSAADHGFTVESDVRSTVVLRESAWDPETAPHLRLAVVALGENPPQEIPLTVVFWSERWHADCRATLTLRASPDEITEVDLRQDYAFSLSPRVANLRLVLTKPGHYRFRLAEVAP